MSLDVYLTKIPQACDCNCDGCTMRNPEPETVYGTNITHNLGTMADKAGIYKALWRPEEIGIESAFQLIPILEQGLKKLKAAPDYYEQFNASNGWGLYKHFVPFVENYLTACKENPEASVQISR